MNAAVPKIEIDNVSVYLVPNSVAIEHWEDTYKLLIATALEQSPIASDNPDAVLEKINACTAGLMQVDMDGETVAIAVLEQAEGKEGPLLHVYALTGWQSHKWLGRMAETLNEAARAIGAIAVSMTGRPGWARTLPQYGFRTEMVTMTMRVK